MTDTDGGGQPDSLMQLLKRANQHATSVFTEATARSGLTMRQFTVLRAVEENDGISQTGLAVLTSIDRSTLAELVARLIDQGYLQRRRTKDDGRTNALRLSPAGRRALKVAEPGAREVDLALLATVPMRYRRALLEGLKALAAHSGGGPAAVPEITAPAPRLRSEARPRTRAARG
jgi:DNA-binding MarR family transcriptional regulator